VDEEEEAGDMSRLKIIYIVSLVILGVLVAFTIFQPMGGGGKYSEVQREQLLQARNQWIIEFDIINNEGRDQKYHITVEVDGKQHNDSVLINRSRMFTYIYHIYPDMITEGSVNVAIYKEGEETPFEQTTYYLKPQISSLGSKVK